MKHHSQIRDVVIIVIVAFAMDGCAARTVSPSEQRARISYFDRNGDGKVDREKHTYPGVSDADWELRDDDFDARYEKKIRYGFAVTESVVDLPVPKRSGAFTVTKGHDER